MPSLKDIKLRITSIRTTQKTTRAMKMVSAAKLRKAQDTLMRLRPYANKLNELSGRMVASLEGSSYSNVYTDSTQVVEKVLVVVVASNRGLCGAFNNAICKTAHATIEGELSAYANAGNVRVLTVGRKAYEYFNKRGFDLVGANHDVFSALSFAACSEVAQTIMDGYTRGEWDRVVLVYNEFKNAMAQNRKVTEFLPVAVSDAGAQHAPAQEYLFEPAREEILTDLIPQILRMRFYRAVLESHMGEHSARMVAMDNATENAEDLLDALKLTYNKARQAAITKELIEIVSGAEALGG
jgi:F-type H+-transporting ATPase subunit gamma